MDYISSPEFHAIFDRVTDDIDFKGKFTAEAIATSLYRAKRKCLQLRSEATSSKQRAKLKRMALQYDRLADYRFPERAIHEAIVNPHGIVAMTLKYGKKEARARILARKKTKLRIIAQRRRIPYPR